MDDRFLSRGKLKADNFPHKKGDWVFGHFVVLKDGDRDIPFIYGFGEIIPETLGGCTGLTDKNGKLIFEGDIVKIVGETINAITEKEQVFAVKYEIKGEFACGFGLLDCFEYEVIGNIHNNPRIA